MEFLLYLIIALVLFSAILCMIACLKWRCDKKDDDDKKRKYISINQPENNVQNQQPSRSTDDAVTYPHFSTDPPFLDADNKDYIHGINFTVHNDHPSSSHHHNQPSSSHSHEHSDSHQSQSHHVEDSSHQTTSDHCSTSHNDNSTSCDAGDTGGGDCGGGSNDCGD